MSGRGSDPDDWFAESPSAVEPRARTGRAAPTGSDETERDAADDWFRLQRRRPGDSRRPPLAPGSRTPLLVAGGVLAVALAAGGLWAGGAFRSSGRQAGRTAVSTPAGTGSTPGTVQSPAPTTTLRGTRTLVAPATTLKPGDQGLEVKRLQRDLVALGEAVGPVDGSYGASTQKAVAAFQKTSSLAGDGVLGPLTLRALRAALRRKG